MFIATVTRTKYRTNGKVDFKLVKGQEVKPSVLRKLSAADTIAWTRKVDKDASINRRIIGRQEALSQLGLETDVNLEALKFISNRHTNSQLLAKKMGQNKMTLGIESRIIKHFNMADRRIELQHTDDFKEGVEATVWIAWPMSFEEAEEVQAFLSTIDV